VSPLDALQAMGITINKSSGHISGKFAANSTSIRFEVKRFSCNGLWHEYGQIRVIHFGTLDCAS